MSCVALRQSPMVGSCSSIVTGRVSRFITRPREPSSTAAFPTTTVSWPRGAIGRSRLAGLSLGQSPDCGSHSTELMDTWEPALAPLRDAGDMGWL
jgi:hypothetical protein